MGDLLFLARCVPLATGNGDESRAFHVLKHLATRKRVHLIAFADDSSHLKHKEALAALTASRSIISRPKPRLGTAIRALATRRSAHGAAFDDGLMRKAVGEILRQRAIDTIYLRSAEMAQFAPARARQHILVDLIEPISERLRVRAKTDPVARRLWSRHECRLLLRHERATVRRADASLFASDRDSAPFLMDGAGRVRVVENGVDTDFYDPQALFRRIHPAGRLIVFAGHVGSARDIAAAVRFANLVLPHVRIRYPDTRFAILGRRPDATIAKPHDGVLVIGGIADRRPWLAAASAVIAPNLMPGELNSGVLEAMAMARPVIASSTATAVIDHAGTIRTADTVSEVATELLWALSNPTEAKELGQSARERVTWRYHWGTCLAGLDLPLKPRGRSVDAQPAR